MAADPRTNYLSLISATVPTDYQNKVRQLISEVAFGKDIDDLKKQIADLQAQVAALSK